VLFICLRISVWPGRFDRETHFPDYPHCSFGSVPHRDPPLFSPHNPQLWPFFFFPVCTPRPAVKASPGIRVFFFPLSKSSLHLISRSCSCGSAFIRRFTVTIGIGHLHCVCLWESHSLFPRNTGKFFSLSVTRLFPSFRFLRFPPLNSPSSSS